MEGGQKEELTARTLWSAISGVIGFVLVVVGVLVWFEVLFAEEYSANKFYGLMALGAGLLMYLAHIFEALRKSKTSQYLRWIMSEADFEVYVKHLQEAKPKIKWTIQNYHYEQKATTAGEGQTTTKRVRVNTHRAEEHYDINGSMDETLSPAQMIAMFHLMHDGDHEDLEANKKAVTRTLFLMCEMPLVYHPYDDEEAQRVTNNREAFYQNNTHDTNQDKSSENLVDCHHNPYVVVILREGTDDSRARPWWMNYSVFVVCTIFLMSVPYRLFFFSQCTKINWEVLKHFSHKHEDSWAEDPQQSRAKRTDAASQAFRKVKR